MRVHWKPKPNDKPSVVMAELPVDPNANERVNEELPPDPVTQAILDIEFTDLIARADEGVANFNDFGMILDRFFKSESQTEGPGFDSSEALRETVYDHLSNAKEPLELLKAHLNAKIDSLVRQLDTASESFSTDIANRKFSQ